MLHFYYEHTFQIMPSQTALHDTQSQMHDVDARVELLLTQYTVHCKECCQLMSMR